MTNKDKARAVERALSNRYHLGEPWARPCVYPVQLTACGLPVAMGRFGEGWGWEDIACQDCIRAALTGPISKDSRLLERAKELGVL